MTAREYREELNLPLKRGVIPRWFRKVKGDIAKENKTAENLNFGAKFRFCKGDERAKIKIGWKSSGGLKPDQELYN